MLCVVSMSSYAYIKYKFICRISYKCRLVMCLVSVYLG